MVTPERLFIVVGAVVAVLLQVFVAPHIALFLAVPNFIAVFAVVTSLVRPQSSGCVLPFVLGLVFDLIGGGPVGAMAFSLTLFTFVLSRISERTGNDSLFVALAFVALGVLLVDLSYGMFLLLFGYNANLFEALAYRVLPCFIYDVVLSLIFSPIARRFLEPVVAVRADITQLR